MDIYQQNINDNSGYIASEALRQVATLLKQVTQQNIQISADNRSFNIEDAGNRAPDGMLSAHGKIVDGQIIQVLIQLVEVTENALLKARTVFKHLSFLGEKVQLVPPVKENNGKTSLWVELKVKAEPMPMARSNAFLSELKKIDALAKSLQSEMPEVLKDERLEKLYENFKEHLDPIYPINKTFVKDNEHLFHWARATNNFLAASCSVAIESSSDILSNFALSVLALAGRDNGLSFARLKDPEANSKSLIEVAQKAPGRVVVSAIQVNQGTNRYERRSEIPLTLVSLSRINKPMIFTGKHEELQAIFHGGQGGINDPLLPVVRHIPEVSMKTLVRYSVQDAGIKISGLSPAEKDRFCQKILNAIKDSSDPITKLSSVTNFLLDSWINGKEAGEKELSEFLSLLEDQTETLAGLGRQVQVKRSQSVQQRYTKVLSDPQLAGYLKNHLIAQDHALEEVDLCLKSQLSKPSHEPFCLCLVGTAGTGKSSTGSLIAKRADIPLVNIDAASYSDAYTARAELRGSGRGLVGSDESGRLEQIAKHHTGVVLEISDLDHAPHQARTAFADQFLKVLEKGEAESATGVTFPCANIIFIFTMNLPEGMDEKLRKGIGFNSSKSRKEIEKDYRTTLKSLFSAAFIRRLGKPVIFEPLSGDSLGLIMERAIRNAILTMADNFRLNVDEITIEKNTGLKLLSSIKADVATYGASAIIELGRTSASHAMLKLIQNPNSLSFKKLIISSRPTGEVIIKPE